MLTVDSEKELMRGWNYEKNATLGFIPNRTLLNSNDTVWWLCKKGHTFELSPKDRLNALNKIVCPSCKKYSPGKRTHDRQVLRRRRKNPRIKTEYGKFNKTDYKPLSVTHPEIANEWDFRKNNRLTPKKVNATYTKKSIWWKCVNGHGWKEQIRVRLERNTSCPQCN